MTSIILGEDTKDSSIACGVYKAMFEIAAAFPAAILVFGTFYRSFKVKQKTVNSFDMK